MGDCVALLKNLASRPFVDRVDVARLRAAVRTALSSRVAIANPL